MSSDMDEIVQEFLVESYEARRWPIEQGKRFDPVDVLHYAIDELGVVQPQQYRLAELAGCRGPPSVPLLLVRP
jgi:hypothetical protein